MSMNSISIRSYQPSDRSRCEEIFKAGMLEYGNSINYINNALQTDMSDIEKNYMQIPDGHWWVAVKGDDNCIVGQVAGQPLQYGQLSYYNELPENERDHVYELRRMAVASEAQRLGVGKQLLSNLINFAREKGYHQVHLTTLRSMKKACAFYERNGFIPGRTEKYILHQTALVKLDDPSKYPFLRSKPIIFQPGETIPDEDQLLMNMSPSESHYVYIQHYSLNLK